VLLAIANTARALPAALVDEMVLAVAVSMMMTPLLYWLAERTDAEDEETGEEEFDVPEDDGHDVIIAGNGRVGQVVGRLLAAAGKPYTALERDMNQVDLLRRYGATVYFGDASRLDLLRAAGAENAKVFVLAISDLEESLRIAETVTRHFPQLKIIARARNRRHAHKLMDLGIELIYRETLQSSLSMSEAVLTTLGRSAAQAREIAQAFCVHDAKLLREQHAIQDSEEKLIQSSKDTAEELERLLRGDVHP
jgi:voltage-gated potassium channel Kch